MAGLAPPSRSSVARRIGKLDPVKAATAREGQNAARSCAACEYRRVYNDCIRETERQTGSVAPECLSMNARSLRFPGREFLLTATGYDRRSLGSSQIRV